MRYPHLILTVLFSVCLAIAGFAAIAIITFTFGMVIAFQDPESSLATPGDVLVLADLAGAAIVIVAAYGFVAWHCWRIRSNAGLRHLRFLHRKASAYARIFTALAVGTGIVCAVLTAYQLGATCGQGNCDADGTVTFGLLAIASELGALACYCWRIR